MNARYRDWIQLHKNIIINDFEYSLNNDSNNNHITATTIEVVVDGTTRHLLQTETKKDCDSWLLGLKSAAFSQKGGAIFGQSLEDTYKYAQDKSSMVPLIVRQCCEYLLENGSTFVGLFRIPGKQSSIKELRDMYDHGFSVELTTSHSPATISSLLKHYLQSLPEPIIPTKYFDDFLEIGSRLKYNETNDLNNLKQLIESSLPRMNYTILAYLCSFLKKLTNHVDTTKMDTDNLAVVFGNNLIRPAEGVDLNMFKGHSYSLLPLIKVLINHSEYLFSNTVNGHVQESYEQNNESITKSSGFSSVSSLLSSNEHSSPAEALSSSMPSLDLATSSSIDSENLLETDDNKSQEELSNEKQTNSTSEEAKNCQVSAETSQDKNDQSIKASEPKNESSNENQCSDNKECLGVPQTVQPRLCLNERLSERAPSRKSQALDNTVRPISVLGGGESPTLKMQKSPSRKGFANKLGKSISSIKLSMSKALQSHAQSNDHDSPLMNSSREQQPQPCTFDLQYSKQSTSELDKLKSLLDTKESLIVEMRQTYREQCVKFDEEKSRLNKIIEELKNENMQLKQKLNIQ